MFLKYILCAKDFTTSDINKKKDILSYSHLQFFSKQTEKFAIFNRSLKEESFIRKTNCILHYLLMQNYKRRHREITEILTYQGSSSTVVFSFFYCILFFPSLFCFQCRRFFCPVSFVLGNANTFGGIPQYIILTFFSVSHPNLLL